MGGEREKLLSRQDLIGVFDEEFEQTEFGTRQYDSATFDIGQPSIGEIERPAAKKGPLRRSRLVRAGCGASAPQDTAHPGQELSGVERLGDVIVGADFQPDDAIYGFAAGGHHDDGNVAARARIATQGQAVLSRQVQVQYNQINTVRIEGREHRRPIARGEDQITRLGELLRHQYPQLLVILDDEDGLMRRTRYARLGLPSQPRWNA